MRWIVLALALAAGCWDDEAAPADAGPDAGPCMLLVHDGADTWCQICASPTSGGTCTWLGNDEPCYYDPHCGGWGDAG